MSIKVNLKEKTVELTEECTADELLNFLRKLDETRWEDFLIIPAIRKVKETEFIPYSPTIVPPVSVPSPYTWPSTGPYKITCIY